MVKHMKILSSVGLTQAPPPILLTSCVLDGRIYRVVSVVKFAAVMKNEDPITTGIDIM